MSLLEIRSVSKRFGGVQALADVTFDVEPRTIVGIMGANGAGKTTLFSLVAGNDRPSTGEIRFRGESIVGLRPDRIARRGIARTFQIVRPFAGLTVFENAHAAATFGTRRHTDATRAAEAALEIVGLTARRNDLAGTLTLSGQKRLEIARAIATGAELLMLDEVMAGLTPAEIDAMLATLAALRTHHRLTVLVIEHVMRALMRLADRIVVLDVGRLIASGTPEEIGHDERVIAAYLGTQA